MKKAVAFVIVFIAAFVLAQAASATDAESSSDVVEENVQTVFGASKRDALRAANAKVETGCEPDLVEYFADKSKFRTLDDGYYTITLENEKCFNVDADGANTDYEGVHITSWQNTEDVSQRFRLVMSEDGTYVLYAACSHGGFSRAVGYNEVLDTVALYSTDSPYFSTFYIKDTGDGDGTKYIVLSTDETKRIACRRDSYNGEDVFLADDEQIAEMEAEGDAVLDKWCFSTWGVSASAFGEKAMYPGNVLLVTQGPRDIYSHQEQNAIDMQVNTGDSISAPFTCRVVAINESCGNVVWVESLSEVAYADGSYDYMTCLFMHDNDISDIYIGEIILQGQDFYEMGTAGFAYGSHVHISCYRGKYSQSMKITGDVDDGVDAWDAFFMPSGIEVYDDYAIPWVYDN